MLDEPANGLDPEGIRWLRGFLRTLSRDQGKTILVSSHLLQEIAQTVDDVVILANGRLVRQGAMVELSGAPSAYVRTADAPALTRALAEASLTATPADPSTGSPGDGGALDVQTDDLRRVGEVALAAGLPVWELRAQRADLEELFLALTEGTNRNEGGRP